MASIKIISPTNDQTILGDKVTISFITGDFTVGQDGYLRLWFDNPVEEASTAARITGNFDYSISDLPVGNHKLTLEAIKTDSQPFLPAVKQTVIFSTINPPTPTITPFPTPFNLKSFANSINWQYLIIFLSLIIISAGIFIKSKWGKPKIWE